MHTKATQSLQKNRGLFKSNHLSNIIFFVRKQFANIDDSYFVFQAEELMRKIEKEEVSARISTIYDALFVFMASFHVSWGAWCSCVCIYLFSFSCCCCRWGVCQFSSLLPLVLVLLFYQFLVLVLFRHPLVIISPAPITRIELPPTDHLPTTYGPPTYWPPTNHLPTDHLPTTYGPPYGPPTDPLFNISIELSYKSYAPLSDRSKLLMMTPTKRSTTCVLWT